MEGTLESPGPNSLLKQGHPEVATQDYTQIEFVLMTIKGKQQNYYIYLTKSLRRITNMQLSTLNVRKQ